MGEEQKDTDTIYQDNMGNLHIWRGKCDVIREGMHHGDSKCLIRGKKRSADVFIQFDTEEFKKEYLSEEEIEELDNGYEVHKKVLVW